MANFGESILRASADVASRRPWLVLLVALCVTLAAIYAGSRLTINTSTDDVLSADLPFRQNDRAYQAAFPEEDLAVVVVDAPTSEEAEAAAADLVEELEGNTELFQRVERAGASPYFDRYAFLFLEP